MEWKEILSAVITSGVVITAFELARDWKNKRSKDKAEADKSKVEVKQTDYEAQKQGLDLVQEFYDKVKQVTDNQNLQIFDRFDKRFDGIEKSVSEMAEYLNGDFAKWKEDKHKNK